MKPLAPLLKTYHATPKPLRGMAFMLISTLTLAGTNAIVHGIAYKVHPLEIAFFRSFFSIFFLLPALLRQGFDPLRTRRFGLLAFRSGLDGVQVVLFFFALSLSPLAKVTALSFSAPLFATLLALFVLHETLRLRRVTALVIGFVGTMVIVRPGFVELDWGSVSVLGFATVWGSAMIVTKALSRTESSLTIALYSALLITPFAFLVCLPVWTTPAPGELALLFAIGGFSSVRQITLAQAFKEADATAVLPLDFTKLIWAAIIGYLVFSEIPSVWTWLGGIMIFGAVTYIAIQESRIRNRETSAKEAKPTGTAKR